MNDKPFLGICLGFQAAVVEFARNQLGLEDAHSTEVINQKVSWNNNLYFYKFTRLMKTLNIQ